MDQDEASTTVDNIVTQFNTYEDFLDSQITTLDLYYLEDEGLARQLVELGYRGTGEVVRREDFEARKAAIEIARLAERTQKNDFCLCTFEACKSLASFTFSCFCKH
ncbi:hypothetical protein FD754_021647 [Muntiacus muntjak]|uniref:Cilia- and flagella-associated protein 299 n=1 Tax=Muntiacus muntjak TaxID=9888 RepID=A0A5N3V8Q1_MUNMU|nr:hypothetical protein FD754_021647 [Muntiacus muntjak]